MAEGGSSIKSLWSGIGSVWSSVKETTLNMVDSLQDQITSLDGDLAVDSAPPPKPDFDRSILPILETPSTYLDEPAVPAFKLYRDTFDLASKTEYISLFYDNSPNLRRIHARLVPSAVPETVFWCRLFFKLDQKEAAKRMSQELIDHLKTEEAKGVVEPEVIDLTPEELEALEKLENAGSDGWNEWE
jgi:hypothetical protein